MEHGNCGTVYRFQSLIHSRIASQTAAGTTKQHHLNEAVRSAKRAVELSPNSILCALHYGSTLLKKSSDAQTRQEVIKEYKRALAICDPTHPGIDNFADVHESTKEARISKLRNQLRSALDELKAKSPLTDISDDVDDETVNERLVDVERNSLELQMQLRIKEPESKKGLNCKEHGILDFTEFAAKHSAGEGGGKKHPRRKSKSKRGKRMTKSKAKDENRGKKEDPKATSDEEQNVEQEEFACELKQEEMEFEQAKVAAAPVQAELRETDSSTIHGIKQAAGGSDTLGSGLGNDAGENNFFLNETIQPKMVYAYIAYVIEERGRYDHGWTSLSNSVAEEKEKRIPISVIPFADSEAAQDYFIHLEPCKSDNIITGYFVHDNKVIVERIHESIRDWIEEAYKSYFPSHSGEWAWWQHICDRFTSIFRDILAALQHIFALGCYSGGVKDLISLGSSGAKLMGVKKPVSEQELWKGQIQDITDLRDLMIEVLSRPSEWRDKHSLWELYKHCARQRVPLDLVSFLEVLYIDSYIKNVDPFWILDDSFFWTSVKKTTFIRKMWYLGYCTEYMDFSLLDPFVAQKVGDWRDHLREWGKELRILDKIKEDKKAYRQRKEDLKQNRTIEPDGGEEQKEKKAEYADDDCKSLELVRLCRHIIEHGIRSCWREKTMDQISDIADKVLKGKTGVCTLMRRACELVWWGTELDQVPTESVDPAKVAEYVRFLLSRKEF